MPRKLGQHFLTSDSVLETIAKATAERATARIIEIGPGKGVLTRKLLDRTEELHVIEIDGALVQYLQSTLGSNPRLHIHHADVLKTDLSQWGAAVIAGNLPYYITSPIIEKFLSLDPRFETAVFLMQWEVAQRILAKPGTRDYGYLTVFSRLIAEVELVCKVPPGAFSPPPKVESGAVRFRRRPVQPAHLSSLLRLTSRSFAQKRKTLRNNLRLFYGAAVDGLPEASLRAEQLTVDQFIDLHARLFSYTETS